MQGEPSEQREPSCLHEWPSRVRGRQSQRKAESSPSSFAEPHLSLDKLLTLSRVQASLTLRSLNRNFGRSQMRYKAAASFIA